MKIALELNIRENKNDPAIFLNYWNNATGNDEIVEIKENKLIDYLHKNKEISLQEFINSVIKSEKGEQ
jgi:hypothetical protein